MKASDLFVKALENEGVQRMAEVWKAKADIRVSDRSLIWNTDLVETLEFENLLAQSVVTVGGSRAAVVRRM